MVFKDSHKPKIKKKKNNNNISKQKIKMCNTFININTSVHHINFQCSCNKQQFTKHHSIRGSRHTYLKKKDEKGI